MDGDHDVITMIPHKFEPRITPMIGIPVVYIDPIALEKMTVIVDIAKKEVGWLGTARQLRTGDFIIDDVYLFDQEVSWSECEMTTEGLEAVAMELLSQEGDDTLYNNLRVWGHSHANMGTSPSAQDDTQMALFKDNGCDWFIRIIANKTGRLEITVFMYRNNLVINDAEWRIAIPAIEDIRSQIETEFAAKVRDKPYKYSPGTVYNIGNWPGGDFDGAANDPTDPYAGMTDDEILEHIQTGTPPVRVPQIPAKAYPKVYRKGKAYAR